MNCYAISDQRTDKDVILRHSNNENRWNLFDWQWCDDAIMWSPMSAYYSTCVIV